MIHSRPLPVNFEKFYIKLFIKTLPMPCKIMKSDFCQFSIPMFLPYQYKLTKFWIGKQHIGNIIHDTLSREYGLMCNVNVRKIEKSALVNIWR